MKKLLLLLFVATVHFASAQETSPYTKNGVPIPVRNTPNNTLIELIQQDSIFQFNIAVAAFPAGKRLAWHSHPGGQILVITEGVGYYQERGKPKQTVKKGEVIKCLPGVEHWHGAAAETGVTYMATYSTQKGTTIWLQPVTDAEYSSTN
jgi:quercetin dioxygenase-like cupin family protein